MSCIVSRVTNQKKSATVREVRTEFCELHEKVNKALRINGKRLSEPPESKLNRELNRELNSNGTE